MEKKGLAVIENFELAINNDIAEIIAEEIGENEQIPYDRVKIPSGGSTVFEIPGDDPDNPDTEKEIEGVIVYAHDINKYWVNEYNGANNLPDCASFDGKNGFEAGTGEIHSCASCPFNEYGSGRKGKGKACKNMKRLYILRSGSLFPMILDLPPTSIKEYKNYAGKNIVKGLRTHHVITKITLKKDKSSDGKLYSKAQFIRVGKVPDAMKGLLTEYFNNIKQIAANVSIDDADCDSQYENHAKNAEIIANSETISNGVDFSEAEVINSVGADDDLPF